MDVFDAVCTSAEPTDDNGTIPTDEQPVITSITIYKNETNMETDEEATVDIVDTNDLDATE